MDDDLPELLYQDRTVAGRLRRYFEYRSIAEMSVWFCIAAAISMIVVTIASVVLGTLVGIGSKSDAIAGAAVLGGLVLWLGFLAWLGWTFVRIARGWGPERLGTPIFRYMQVTFLVMTALTMLPSGVLFKEGNIFPVVLLAFDTVIVGMVFVFLLLAWSARCRVPWRTYAEVFGMAAMLIFEIFLTKPWTY
jgi:hypothetical protein